jgi:hypothetical protein
MRLPWPYIQSFTSASSEDREHFHVAGVRFGVWKATDPVPATWECDRCGNRFHRDVLLITANVSAPMPCCPVKPDEAHICPGDGWDVVHPVDDQPATIVGAS